MSPILVRPVREQLEHDRVIRLLQVKLKRRNDVTANIGEDQSTPIKIGLLNIFPDLVLTSADRSRKLIGTVEVETSESVNHLEARAQWAHLGKARAPFHLYVPASSVEIARRLATENQVNVSEIWSYHSILDQTRFTLVYRAPESRRRGQAARVGTTTPTAAAAAAAVRPVAPAARPEKKAVAAPRAAKVEAKPAVPAKSAKAATPAKPRAALRARRPPSRSSRAAAPARSARPAGKQASKPSAAQKRK